MTEEKLEFPLGLSWVYESPQHPCPAWPEPSREMHRLDFDYAFQPVAVNGLVYFGSSADDTIRALEMRTGKVKWRFTTGGPIRFAPHIANGKCYAASDDGFVYCLDAAAGNLLWTFRAAPEDRQVIGNGRMISRWPCRSGVLVADGVVYGTAGMWPSEGVYVYSLDANTGKQLWCNDTSGSMHMIFPHQGYGMGGVAPQGYLLASGDRLLVPAGRSVPAGFERSSGKFLYRAHFKGKPFAQSGGGWATIAGDRFYNPAHGKGPDCYSETLGASGPLKGDGMRAYDLGSGEWGGWGEDYTINDRQLVLLNAQMRYDLGSGKVEAIDCAGRLRTKWVTDHPRVYCVALAEDALLVGGEGTITAFAAADGKQIWRTRAKGQVRGLAIASGRIIAADESGRIYCFAPGKREGNAAFVGPGTTSGEESGETANVDAASGIANLIQRFNITRGYALIIGKSDARLAETLAGKTQLQVLSALRDKDRVVSERKRLVEKESVYGSNLNVQHLEDTARLPYASNFANLIVVCANMAKLSGKELYRVLRPCGGLMCFPDASREDVETLFKEADVPEGELSLDGESIVLVRGKLSGAFDWNSKVTTDQRVKWPLELSWFGGPGPARMALHRQWPVGKPSNGNWCLAPPTPAVANGRYFAIGKNHLIAVDAYNGSELWSRWIGNLVSIEFFGKKKQVVSGDEDSVYVNCFYPPDYCLQLDAQTGKIRKIYNESGKQDPSPRLSLETIQTFTPHAGPKYAGTVSISRTPDGLDLTLVTKTPEVTSNDSWELYFDFRAAEDRLLPYGSGAFHAIIIPDSMLWRPGRMSWYPYPGLGPAYPELVMKQKEVADGAGVVLRITWEEIRRITGNMPKDFTFAATLNMYAGEKKVVEKHLFADGSANFLGHGWAIFTLDGTANKAIDNPSIVPWGKLNDLPAYAKKPVRMPGRDNEDPYRYFRGVAQNIQRGKPLTGKAGSNLTYFRSYGCMDVISSSTMDFFRSATIGFYDLADDSGMRNFAGSRPGCGISMVPALGLLISSENASGCQCSYSFQTSLALAPAAKRRNEDWAIFNDRLETAPIQQAALNLGAPGDRRDEEGILWLGIPRMKERIGAFTKMPFFRVPIHVDYHDDFGPYRFNADRLTINNTERPWIYASGYRGLKSASLDLLYYDPRSTGIRFACRQPPKIDGNLHDPCWDGSGRLKLFDRKIDVYLREDPGNLYIAFEQRATISRKGKTEAWTADTKGEDAPVWEDDSFEVYIQNPQVSKYFKGIHLGVSASGARYDGLWDFPANVAKGEENSNWNGTWSSAVEADADRFCVEMAIPWKTLSTAGINEEEPLQIKFGKGKLKIDRGLRQLLEDFNRTSHVVNPGNLDPESRPYTVRLHFAEPDNVVPKQRVFDVKLQDTVVLKDFDIIKEAGGRNTAVVKAFNGITADKTMELQFIPKAGKLTEETVPILSGIEVVAEQE